VLLGALVAVCIGGCGGGSEGCPAQEKSARPDRVPAGQAWLLGVGVDGRRSTVYAMTSRGLFASHDQGRSWRRLGAGGQVVGFDASRPRHLLATGRHGLSVSFDAGDTWLRAGLPDCVAPLDGAAFARSRGLVYGWASGPLLAHDPYRAAVVLSRDGGRSFAKIA
jgi:hypothetical protein